MTDSRLAPPHAARPARPSRPLAALAISAALVAAGCAQLPGSAPTPVARGVSASHLDAFMGRIEADSRAGRLPGAVLLVARDGRVEQVRAVGVRDPASGAPMSRDSIFRIYSMTKPVVSVAAMILVEEGRLRLADPVSRWIPEMRGLQVAVERPGPDGRAAIAERVAAPREMTVQDLLRHTSGLTYGTFGRSAVKDEYLKAGLVPGAPNVEYDLDEMVRRLGRLPLSYAPGSTWEYSVSTDVLGVVVQRASGQRLDAFLQARVFGPLGMRDTGFSVPPEKHGRIAEPFPADPDTKQKVELLDVRRPPALLSGGGGLVSTVDDYLRFARMMQDGGALDGVRIVSRKTVEYMTADHLGSVRGPAYSPGAGYGFGLGVAVRLADGQAASYGSAGEYNWAGYAGTAFWIDPKERLIAIFMMQGPGQSAFYRSLLRSAVYTSLDR
jgi:CubicO group peptidase (beta-lactamase class C family)